MLDENQRVNCSLRTGITPLMMACDQRVDNEWEKMQKHMIRALLVNNADVNATDNLGRTCLEYAALTGDIQLVRAFLSQCIPMTFLS
jgi:ankyrin repeat protein